MAKANTTTLSKEYLKRFSNTFLTGFRSFLTQILRDFFNVFLHSVLNFIICIFASKYRILVFTAEIRTKYALSDKVHLKTVIYGFLMIKLKNIFSLKKM